MPAPAPRALWATAQTRSTPYARHPTSGASELRAQDTTRDSLWTLHFQEWGWHREPAL